MIHRERSAFEVIKRIIVVGLCQLGAVSAPLSADISWPQSGWVQSDPASEGMDAEAIGQLDAEIRAGVHGNIDSMMIVRFGRVVFQAEYERDYTEQHQDLSYPSAAPWDYLNQEAYPFRGFTQLHSLQSVSKSVMSALIGIAIDRGELPGLDATLGELLPHRNIVDPALRAIRLENLLTMTSGIQWNEEASYFDPTNDATASEATEDWVGFLLKKPRIKKPGEEFNYNSAVSQSLSEILATATGIPTNIYAERYLFEPIGIKDYYWNDAPEGFSNAGGGLFLAAADLARFTLLFAQMGEWNGRQVISREWIERSRTSWVTAYPDSGLEWGYGYQWWIYRQSSQSGSGMYGGWGWGGQFPLVVPDLGLVAVFTGWNIRDDADYAYPFDLFYDRIVLPLSQ